VGYSSGQHALRIRSAATGAILTRRDVEFDEIVPPSLVIAGALLVCPHLYGDWFEDGCSSDDEGDGVPAPAGSTPGVPTVDNLTDAVALLPAAALLPPPNFMTVPLAAPTATHDYNLWTRTGSGRPSAF